MSVAAVPGVNVTGEGWAVTPAGKPATATCTLAENPFWGEASSDTAAGVPPEVRFTDAGMAVNEKSAAGAAAVTLSDACALTVCPLTDAVKRTAEVLAAAEEAAVKMTGSATPGVTDGVAGFIVTPAGSPDTAIAVAPEPPVSSREVS